MYKPKPVPLSDFVANLQNKRGKISGWIPLPVSSTLTITLLFVFSIFIFINPSSVNYNALLNKLLTTWLILSLSPDTFMSTGS